MHLLAPTLGVEQNTTVFLDHSHYLSIWTADLGYSFQVHAQISASAVNKHTFLAQAAKKGSLALPLDKTLTTASLSHLITTLLPFHMGKNFKGQHYVHHLEMDNGHIVKTSFNGQEVHKIVPPATQASQTGI